MRLTLGALVRGAVSQGWHANSAYLELIVRSQHGDMFSPTSGA
jgi:hypothetical protein